MSTFQTAWGEISAAYCTKGPGSGEIHIGHDGTLSEHAAELEKIVRTFKGRSLKLTHSHWVIKVDDATEKIANGFGQAIIRCADRAEKAKKANQAKLQEDHPDTGEKTPAERR